ncbi:hypothetical protein HAX54_037016, partial [Datura stramonium]|nr:hypothetical protein [Datura stramonium]
HETINKVYSNFKEELEESQDVEEQELEETPTSSVKKLPMFNKDAKVECPKRKVLKYLTGGSKGGTGLLTKHLRSCNKEVVPLENVAKDKTK